MRRKSSTQQPEALPFLLTGADMMDPGAMGTLAVHTGETPGATRTYVTEQTDLLDALDETPAPRVGIVVYPDRDHGATPILPDGRAAEHGPWCTDTVSFPPPPRCGTCTAPSLCPVCGTPRTWDTDPADQDAETFAWCPSCSVATFPSEDPTTVRADGPCATCQAFGVLSCRETVGTCGLCGQEGDVFTLMDYDQDENGRPVETVCLSCIDQGRHMAAAHAADADDDNPFALPC